MKKRREKKITPCYKLHPYGLPALEKADLKYCDLRIIQKYAIKPSIIRPTEKSGDRKNCMRNTYKKKYVRRLWKKKKRACIRRLCDMIRMDVDCMIYSIFEKGEKYESDTSGNH